MLFVLLLFGIFAMAALVIDIGFARLAQRQMQTAADAAALEGLRGEGDPSMSYEVRQDAAEQLIAWTFDDDLDASNGDDGIAGDGGQFGAGPLVQFADGVVAPTLFASQFMSVDPDNAAYKPELQRSQSNVEPNRFRVAIQRGDDIVGEFDVFAQGPHLPYLFARGSLIPRDRIGEGISVGATAIAALQPVVCVGNAVDSANIPGKLDIAVPISEWIAGTGSTLQDYPSNAIGGEVGDSVDAPRDVSGYVAIFDPQVNNRVIGFGPAAISDASFQRIAAFETPNASAVFSYPFNTAGDDNSLLFERREFYRDELYQLPASVR